MMGQLVSQVQEQKVFYEYQSWFMLGGGGLSEQVKIPRLLIEPRKNHVQETTILILFGRLYWRLY